ncbi:biotin--[acetyl-CoA-carboxylase] ligase [Methanolobus psychrotolerans]|uniref:biotin--[acetyl-CoA-carboxylase] ligase n=1 Tax=Methanolobus psychrotolerans TaxID=1874706 RepID=UPI001A913AB8|nr:biotin--[acetyl-CoA-carboxylase] ligase [Methanolobus psychrotolerans]
MNDNRKEIIRLLRQSEGNPVSGQEIGVKLGITRAMVWKYIKALRKDGYDIRSSPKIGYILDAYPDRVDPDELKKIMRTSLIGNDIRYYSELDSTNNTAREIAPKSPEGTVVIAETQNKGRGRMGSEWQSIPGGIWLSLILKPSIPLDNVSKITLVAGIAVTTALRNIGVDARIKWPNDVLVKGKKICGILTEVSAEVDKVDYIILGIGINANVKIADLKDEIRKNSTSIANEMGNPIDRTAFVASLLYELEQQYIKFKTQQFTNIVDEWINLSDTIGKEVKVTTPSKLIEGKAVGITEKGALVVLDRNNKKQEIIAGNCRYRY